MNDTGKPRPRRLGIYLAAIYILIVVAVYIGTVSSRPDDGMEWIPFVFLSMPWYAMSPNLLFPGFVANAGLLFLAGTLIQTMWRRMRRADATGH
jgi:hypothetical protein